jgi:LuxR family maltose regulon positive regulatory protein
VDAIPSILLAISPPPFFLMNSQASSTQREQPVRALERLDLLPRACLAILIAPASSGKTSSLITWAAQWKGDSQWKFTWVFINEEDNIPATFLKHLENAISRLESIETLSSAQEDDLEDGMIRLINILSGVQDNVVLIFDNYQAISSPSIHTAVQLVLDYLPPQVHVIIASQSEPPLALPRMRVRRQLLELGLEDLRMEPVDI